MGWVDGKTAVVTGAGSGIGAVIATTLAAEGAAVAVADLNLAAAEKTVAQIVQAGGKAVAVAFDLGDDASVRNMIDTAAAELGGLDILVNNAAATHLGGTRDKPIEDADVQVWDDTMRINLRGTMLATKYAVPHLLARGGGSIVNTASGAGLTGDLGHPAYGASKAAVVRLTTYTATEYGKRNIRANAVSPGLVVTPATENSYAGPMGDLMLKHHLTPRLGRPQDIADAVLFLASDRSAFITGQILPVDGGLLAHAPYTADISALSAT
jgi:NAD(P)-dependent dehydrogenase (short-subunit alcohol dehydrogenase family)